MRVDVNPTVLHSYGLSLEDVRAVLNGANANRPKGEIADDSGQAWTINTTDQLLQASEYQPLIISYKQGAAVRLADVAEVTDASEDIRNTGLVNGKPAILLLVWRQPGANIIATVDRVRAILPQLQTEIPPTVNLLTVIDRTITIRASVTRAVHVGSLDHARHSGGVHLFGMYAPPSSRAWSCPCRLSVPSAPCISSASLNNLSLMALTIATGFVVDDAIVVIENIMRHLSRGHRHARRRYAAPKKSASRSSRSPFSPGGVHSDPPDGWDLWAPLPGIRRDPGGRCGCVDGGLSHHDPDDVRPAFSVPIATRDTAGFIVLTSGCSKASSACTRSRSRGSCGISS